MDSPAIGQADLSRCEGALALAHPAASVQPHGLLLVLREGDATIVQASANSESVLGCPLAWLLGRDLAELGGDLAAVVAALAAQELADPLPFQCAIAPAGHVRRIEGAVHRHAGGGLVLELEAIDPAAQGVPLALWLNADTLAAQLAAGVQRFTAAASLSSLADTMVQVFRELIGHDRVMVCKFDTEGHGKIIAEACAPHLAPMLGRRHPATDIPQRARARCLRNRVRLLVDVDATAQPLQPPLLPLTGGPLDMSLCDLRSMSPLHLQSLKDVGAVGTLEASLVREGKLWGLLVAHHDSPRHLRRSLRAAVGLLAEAASTRIAAIENYAHAQVALMVRRLEQRLIEATSTEGDWRLALFRNPRTLLQPLEASGAALFHDGEILTSGDVPSTPELRALRDWVDAQQVDPPFACSSVGQAQPALQSLAPTAAGVMAVKLSTSRPDYLMWFRREQPPGLAGGGEQVRGTAAPWTDAERVMARAVGVALVDIIVQVHAVRLLIAEHQLAQIRATVGTSREPVLVANPAGLVTFANEALVALMGDGATAPECGTDVAHLFDAHGLARRVLDGLALQPWRGEWGLLQQGGPPLPVAVRAEAVPGRDGALLGFILTLTDLRDSRRAAQARRHLEESLASTAQQAQRAADPVVSAILTNASLAAMDIADGAGVAPVAPVFEELELSAQRAAALYAQIRRFAA